MRLFIITICLFFGIVASSQSDGKLENAIQTFHRALVEKNISSINQYTDNELSYGHSNGWVETRTDLIRNLETGFMVYKKFREDSLEVKYSGTVRHARFIADIDAVRDGKEGTFHLKVLEIWIRKENRWILFARQAVKG